jgi:hypothetical protein
MIVSMKPDSTPSSMTYRILRLAPLGASTLLLVSACGASDSAAADTSAAPGSEASPVESSTPAPTAPAVGEAAMNTESLAPVLDGAGAAEAAAPAGATPGEDSNAQGPNPEPSTNASAPASAEAGDAGAPPETDPSLDENLVFIEQDGFQTTYFALDCRSIAKDGSVIDGAPNAALLVGGGRTLECNLERFPSRAATDVLSAANEPWCVLGELQSYESGGDDRLTITIATSPDVAPARLIGTRDGEEVSVMQAAAFGGRLWPLWIDAFYDVIELARAEQGKTCDQVFGL